jgi:hypothetical protein
MRAGQARAKSSIASSKDGLVMPMKPGTTQARSDLTKEPHHIAEITVRSGTLDPRPTTTTAVFRSASSKNGVGKIHQARVHPEARGGKGPLGVARAKGTSFLTCPAANKKRQQHDDLLAAAPAWRARGQRRPGQLDVGVGDPVRARLAVLGHQCLELGIR